MRSFIVLVVMVLSGFYLLNPGAGWIECVPDAFPLIGNLDEASAVLLFVACLRYFGVDLTRLFAREPTPRTLPRRDTPQADDRPPDGR